jgi:NADPH:quinone reductase-like Zn-dependent oxidoreductase
MSVKAIAVNQNPLLLKSLAMPQPGEHDLLVEVKAVSVNPVDTKVHAGIAKRAERAAHSRVGCQRDRQSRWGWRDRIQTGR